MKLMQAHRPPSLAYRLAEFVVLVACLVVLWVAVSVYGAPI